ncbi:branched-chain amino acid ABC transporter permease [Halorubellus salinus]|uniref:branched-chain amino acid ABC transporter permease n=1 Tax=Halorubellus salinus TaxID=755309 RepID=UPI001D09097B|nr:branched-chain amino acid ABC transporter permease [Halorubellus salinus]
MPDQPTDASDTPTEAPEQAPDTPEQPMTGIRERLQFARESISLRHVIAVVAFVALALLPFEAEPILMLKLTAAFYFAMFAMSWDVVSGYTGELSFGHSFLFGIGGYGAALMTLEVGTSPAVSIAVGTLAAMVGGLVIGAPALRLKGPYFAIITFLLPTALLDFFIVYKDVFGGELGLSSPDYLVSAETQLTTIAANYYLALAVLAVLFVLLYLVTRSNTGKIFTAIRESEDAVGSVGINPAKFKIFAFVLSAGVGGFAAAMFVHTPAGSPNPTQLLAVTVSINVLLATIFGGIGTISGAALGGVLFYMVRDWLSDITTEIPLLGIEFGDVDLVIFSLVILAIIYFLPGGILGGIERLVSTARGEEPDRVMADGGGRPLERIVDRYRRSFANEDGDDTNSEPRSANDDPERVRERRPEDGEPR